ncbi:LamG domain-containing protein, partial [Candidatus Micrarchaeota archaeon]|nr:LamG domain-containing protein [Candidatus Micrarchaeota archaeon]
NDGLVDEDPVDTIDNDNDTRIDEDSADDDFDGLFDEDSACMDAVEINFEYVYDITDLAISPTDDLRVNLMATFGSAGPRGGSGASCTADVNCNGVLDVNDPATTLVDESETDNVRTIQQRHDFNLLGCTPVCEQVHLVDTGAYASNMTCVDLPQSTTLDEYLSATGTPETQYDYAITGAVSCKGEACTSTVTNTAELLCEDSSLVYGSPASASFEVICQGDECEIEPGDFCTYTQGGYGAPQQGKPRAILFNNFASVYPSGMVVGDEGGADNDRFYMMNFTSAQAVNNYLPQGGTAGYLNADLVNPTNSSSGIFGGQLTAALLNLKFDDAGIISARYEPGALGGLHFKQCEKYNIHPALVGKTVNEVIAMSNCAIQSGVIDLTTQCGVPPRVGISALNDALNAFNNNFDNCDTDNGCLEIDPDECEYCVDAPAGMVSWWDGDNATVPEDIWGDNDGVFMNNATISSAGMVGSAFLFDGVNDYVSIPDPTGGLSAFTFDAWVKFDNVSRDEFIAGDWGNGWLLFERYGMLQFYVRGASGNTFIENASTVGTTGWHHVAATYDGSGMAYVYLDGVQSAKSAAGKGVVAAGSPTARLGHSGYYSSPGNTSHLFFEGMIDEVEIYNRALNATEIKSISDSLGEGKCKEPEEPPPEECVDPPTSVFAWYQGENNVNDIIGGYDGSMVGGDGDYYGTGYVGQAFKCDATDGSYIDLTPLLSAPELNSNDGSVDMWVYLNGASSAKREILTISDSTGTELFQIVDDLGYLLVTVSKNSSTDSGAMWSAVSNDLVLTPDTWHHIAVTFDGQTLKMYVDGISVPFAYSTGNDKSGWWDDVVSSADNLKVCIRDNGYWTEPLPMDGLVDEIEFFSAPLTSDEVLGIYEAGHEGKCLVECTETSLHATENNHPATGATKLEARIYRIFPSNGTASLLYGQNISLLKTNVDNFNGNAWDPLSKRFYFAEYVTLGASYSPLYFYGPSTHTFAGNLTGAASGGTFHNGYYYYVKERTDDFMKVSFNPDGTLASETKIADLFGTGSTKTLAFGDIAINNNNEVYFSLTELPSNTVAFGKFNLDGTGYQIIKSGNLYGAGGTQIAFGDDGVLYGVNARTPFELFTINTATGATSFLATMQVPFSDLAAGSCANYAPIPN